MLWAPFDSNYEIWHTLTEDQASAFQLFYLFPLILHDVPEGKQASFCHYIKSEDGIRDPSVTGVQTCALPIYLGVAGNGRPVGLIAVLGPPERQRVAEVDEHAEHHGRRDRAKDRGVELLVGGRGRHRARRQVRPPDEVHQRAADG